MSDSLALTVAQLQELKILRADMRRLEARERELRAALDPVLHPLFDRAGNEIMMNGVQVRRRVASRRVDLVDPMTTAVWLVGGAIDAFGAGTVSKAKLDKLGAVYSDGVPILEGEPVPGARVLEAFTYAIVEPEAE